MQLTETYLLRIFPETVVSTEVDFSRVGPVTRVDFAID